MVIEMAAEERRKSPTPKQKEKIEDTNETHHSIIEEKEEEEEEEEAKGEEEEGKWLKHYSSVHQILLVGEGDFSFSLSLANAFGSASNMVTTSLDRFDDVIKKYRNAKSNLENLVKLGATVLHGVDATKMKLHTDLSMRKFDRIIFNFPHAGFHGKEDHIHLIRSHRNLVQDFFKNASRMLRPFGEIHVSHKTKEPYHRWDLGELASKCSLTLMGCVNFEKDDYPGYNNKRGDGPRCDEPFHLGECRTYKFRVNTQKERTSEAKAAYTCEQSLNITQSQHTRSAGMILEESQFGSARNFSRNDHLHGFDYQQPHHTRALSELPRAQLGNYLRHPEGNDCLLCIGYQEANVAFPVSRRFFNHTDTTNISTDCLRIFGGYFRHNHEMFGRMDYDFCSAVQGFLNNGYEIYMNEQPRRAIDGYVRCLQELHHLTVLRLGLLRMLLGPDMW